jgi:hypothetical protein
MLAEARREVAALRTDVFASRRLAEERRQALDALQAERTGLAQQLEASAAALREALSQLAALPALQQRCAQQEQSLLQARAESERAAAAHRILSKELEDERRLRDAVLEQKALVEGERARLAKQRDELSAQLRVAQARVRDAEEEQLRAEDEAAGLRAEVVALRQAHQQLQHTEAAGPASSTGGGVQAEANAASVAAASALAEQLEQERSRASHLMHSLQVGSGPCASSERCPGREDYPSREASRTSLPAGRQGRGRGHG